MENTAKKTQELVVETTSEEALSIRSSDLVAAAARAVIDSEENASKGVDLLKMIKDQAKNVDKERRLIVDPLNQVVKHVNGRFKPITTALKDAERQINTKLTTFQREQARIAEEARKAEQARLEEEALREAEAKAEKGDIIGADSAVDEASRKTVISNPEPQRIQGSETGVKSSIVKRWTYKITDIAALAKARPDMVEPKAGAIMGAFRNGEKEIAGVEFYQEESVSVR